MDQTEMPEWMVEVGDFIDSHAFGEDK